MNDDIEVLETILIQDGISEVEPETEDGRLYVKLFDADGSVLFHGKAAVVRVEALGLLEKK